MECKVTNKHARIILNHVRENYIDKHIDNNELDLIIDNLNSKINVNKDLIKEYLNKYTKEVDSKFIFKIKPTKKNIDTADNKDVDTTDNKTVDTTDNKAVDTTDNKTVDTTDNKAVDTTDNKTVDTTDNKAVDTTDNKTIDTTDNKTVDTTEIININTDDLKDLTTEEITITNPELQTYQEESKKKYKKDRKKIYLYPEENPYDIEERKDLLPYSKQWIHDDQIDDDISSKEIKSRIIKYNNLCKLIFYEQRSKEWFEQRERSITASALACVLGKDHYSPQYQFIINKVEGGSFAGTYATHHGKKLEDVAVLIYEYRMNVRIKGFGCIEHPKYPFLACSPDGIINHYKNNEINKTELIGRLIEIKCPSSRKLLHNGDLRDVPEHYLIQVLFQLIVTDMDECDFWQTVIQEYQTREDFILDTDPKEPFRSLEHGKEKGVLIQLLPKDKVNEENKIQTIYDYARYIYPPEIEMTPFECDQFVIQKLLTLETEYPDCVFDKVLYWKLIDSECTTVKKDMKWFSENLPQMKKIWSYVELFRKNPDKYKILKDYIGSLPRKINDKIMKAIEIIATEDTDLIKKLIKETKLNIELKKPLN